MKHLTKWLLAIMIIPILLTAAPTQASARSFGGSRSGGFRSYHTTPSTRSTYRSTTPKTTTRTYRSTQNGSTTKKYYRSSGSTRSNGYGSSFGHGIAHGAGFAVGNHIMSSFFGMGQRQYYDNSGQVQTYHRGYAGWIIIIIIVIVIVMLIRKRNNRNDDY